MAAPSCFGDELPSAALAQVVQQPLALSVPSSWSSPLAASSSVLP